MEYIRILDSNDVKSLDEYIKKNGVNQMVNGASLLFWAVYRNRLSFVLRLLELGADPNHKDSMGRTPLEIGCYYGFYEVCKTLLEHGGKLDEELLLRAEKGWDENRQVEIIELLKKWKDR